MNFLKAILGKLVDGGKVGGWVRAAVAAVLTMAVAKLSIKVPFVAELVTPDTIDYVAVAAATFVTGILSQASKA